MAIDRTQTLIYCPACDAPLTIPLTIKHTGQGEAIVSGDMSALRTHLDESRPGPSSTPSDDTAHRDALRILLSRATRCVLLPDEAALLRQHVETDLAAGDRARAELATMRHVARVNGRAHRYAYQASVEARAELDQARQRAGDLSEEHDVRRKALADALDVGWHQSWDQLIEEARFDSAALARQRDTAEAAIAEQAEKRVEIIERLNRNQADTIRRVRDLTERWERGLAPDFTYARSLYVALDGPQHTCPDGEPCPPHDEPAPGLGAALARARKPAYDAVYAYLRTMPRGNVERNAIIWRAVQAALDAMQPDAPEAPDA